jgi:molybdopterin-containing oxidoreductase family iron-sulfur binding subunit
MQIESTLSVTGSNADKRAVIQPSEEKYLLAELYKHISDHNTANTDKFKKVDVSKIADILLDNKGKSLVVSASNDPEIQSLVIGINHILKNYGETINIDNPVYLKQGDDKRIAELVKSMNKGEVDTLITYDTNPVYSLPNSDEFKEGMKKVKNTIALATEVNETADLCDYICPDHHFAESWNDYQPKENHYSLAQPAISNIFNTRQAQASLLKWSGKKPDYLEYIKSYWKNHLFSKNDKFFDFRQFWNKSLQDGIFKTSDRMSSGYPSVKESVIQKIVDITGKPNKKGIELHSYESVAMASGKYANNPWLQELPDPISQVCWDNYAAISPALADEHNIKTGDVININKQLEIPVVVQPGQSKNTISIPVGYGRSKSGKVGQGLGVNIYPLLQFAEGHRMYSIQDIQFQKTGKTYSLASTQLHNSMEGRDIVRSMKLEEFLNHPASDKEGHKNDHHSKDASLYPKHEYKSHHWGMVVDLSACVGCNACSIACSVENNIPVVGREEVRQAHEMHWIRMDRYYAGDPENPEVLRQPLMCQHCDNAPCENVCPVQATTHSSEGVNQMAYNRCIGTRYCNNNCPYKVRRFNWHDYNNADAMPGNLRDAAGMTLDLPRMILNPDVTVRAKGVIEKCNFCIQRIQAGKLTAKSEKRKLKDDDIQTACQQACPADAIVFGDMNDPDSKISKILKSNRKYRLQEHLHTLPSVTYMNQVKNELI